jgi:hypothetical protein
MPTKLQYLFQSINIVKKRFMKTRIEVQQIIEDEVDRIIQSARDRANATLSRNTDVAEAVESFTNILCEVGRCVMHI